MRVITMIGRLVAVALLTFSTVAPTGAIVAAGEPDDEPEAPATTVNEFLPEDRGLSECISAVPKPGCGSEARGGWRQNLVFALIVVGLAVIAWRVVAGTRAAQRTAGPLDQRDQRR